MDPSYRNKKIIDLSEEEIDTLAFLGPNLAPGVRVMVNKVRANPTRLGFVTCFTVDIFNRKNMPPSPHLKKIYRLSSPTNRELDTFTIIFPDLISKYEANFYYHGISGDPPKLMWRSDLKTNPFPTPPPGARFFNVPTKTAHGVFNTPLNNVWDIVAPKIILSIKAHGLKYSALKAVRFSILKDKNETFGPVVVWIAVQPYTTNARAVCNATPDILGILADANVTGITVEWYEGSVQKLVGPPLMKVEDPAHPSFGFDHPFNTGLGIPIARLSDGAEGTLTFLFREVKDSNGHPSNRILALTNKHVASTNSTTNYEFSQADPQHILVCGKCRFAHALEEIEDVIDAALDDSVGLTEDLEALESTPGKQNDIVARRNNSDLKKKDEDITTLQALLTELETDWKDVEHCKFGLVDWAPEISVRVDDRHYTRDIATFAVDESKLQNFRSNIVDLGNQYNAKQLEHLFWPNAAARNKRRIPKNLQLPVRSALPYRLVINPDMEDENGMPSYIVAKYGNTTKLTLGRYSGMEAYTCTDLGLESREVAVYNYGKSKFTRSDEDFSEHGDSGSLIFTGDGNGLAILHSGMPRGMNNHVTFGTPLWWVIKQIRVKYPSAEFYNITYTLD